VTRKARRRGEKEALGNPDSVIQGLIESINKGGGFGIGTVRGKHGIQEEVTGVVPTGSFGLDKALGVGGVPEGRIIEIYGPESSGKTTLALHIIANAQELGKIAAFIDAEHALDAEYAAALGVDLNRLLLSQPDSGEVALNVVDNLIRTEKVGVIVVDSVAALVPQAELEGDIGDHVPGGQARLMSQALRKIIGVVSKSECIVIFINQIRHKIGVRFGSPETTSGGNALKFYASVRLDIRRIGSVKKGDSDPTGNRTRVKVVKNKVAPPFKKAEFDIAFGIGIDQAGELLDIGVSSGVITRSGAYYYNGPKADGKTIAQGRDRTKIKILEDLDLFGRLKAAAIDG
tara:strand:- start:128 stop:1162 length:1035 start_codon:yes stop_codon:yes gene_type:complete